MAHHSVESMRDRAFTKGRAAFKNDAEYQAALRGEVDDLDGATEEQVDMGGRFRDVLNGTPNLDEGKLDWIAKRLVGFRDKTTNTWLMYPGHFTLKPAGADVVTVVDVGGEFAVRIDDALEVVSEMAEAMECAKPSGAEEIAEKIAETVVSDGKIEDPVLSELSEALVEDDLDVVFDFMKDDYHDVDLDCGKILRWRRRMIDGKFVVIDDPDAQTWFACDVSDIKKAVVAADRRMRCEKLADALAELDSCDEELSAKVLAVAKDVEKGMYAEGKTFDLTDEDGYWLANILVCEDGRVFVDVDAYGETVEVSREDFVKVTKKFFEGFGK